METVKKCCLPHSLPFPSVHDAGHDVVEGSSGSEKACGAHGEWGKGEGRGGGGG
jgi:hypothetical protein